MNPDPTTSANVSPEEFGKIAVTVIGIITFLWGVFYKVARPFIDEQRYQSWIRKSNEAECHMREQMFKEDFARRKRTHRLAVRGLRIATKNAESIHDMMASQQETTKLLAPLTQAMEHMVERLGQMNSVITQALEVAQGNANELSAHRALLEYEERPEEFLKRRIHRRRATDDIPHDQEEHPR